ncbi:efflux transporter, RND family, MFP protein [Amphritea japonica ATCC BAA-1530]|uniref:Efflux transporter, RND family, MFP protein n=2 Tax=Amphritea TaxID=515417 RepID=A0A7R6PG35_9GAMM|nr:efflux transporter, RND family, MFP protein [Amphritea japonica ATCC BAA-1530]
MSVLPLLCIAFTAVASEPGPNESLPALDCIINPSEKIDLGSYSPGIIAEVLVKRGDRVVKEQVLARLDDRVEQASVALAKARAGIKSELEGGNVNLTFDRYAYQRITDLYRTNAVSQQDKEQAERSVKLSSTSVKQAKEQSRIRELELSRAEALLDQRVIRSPFDGVVQRNLKFRGEYVDEQPVVQLVSLNPLYVETMVPIQFFGQLQVNSLAEIYPEVNSGESIEARVIAIDPVGDVGSSAFGVQLEMANTDYAIPAGIKCDLKFTDQVAETVSEESTVDASEAGQAEAVEVQAKPSDERVAEPVTTILNGPDVSRMDTAKSETTDLQSEVVTPQLVKLGPYAEEEFKQAAALLENEGISFTSETEVTKVKIGYILLLKGQKDALHNAVTDLRHHGLKDIEYLSYGAYKGSVSLGVFYDESSVNSRETFVSGFGYVPERVTRYRKRSLVTVIADVREEGRLASIGL